MKKKLNKKEFEEKKSLKEKAKKKNNAVNYTETNFKFSVPRRLTVRQIMASGIALKDNNLNHGGK